MVAAHPTYDDFWRERSAWEILDSIKVPLYSSGVWAKMQLHTRGNIDGYLRATGPKKLRMSGVPNAWAAAAEFSSVEFHKNVLLPFYDHYLRGKQTDYLARPNVEYAVRGANLVRKADTWPPPNTRYTRWFLNASPSGSVSVVQRWRPVANSHRRRGINQLQLSKPGMGQRRRRLWSGRPSRRL